MSHPANCEPSVYAEVTRTVSMQSKLVELGVIRLPHGGKTSARR
jgi:hypothetical protein